MIDNFSRTVLAWRVSRRFEPANAVMILVEARQSNAPGALSPTLLSDATVENVNAQIDGLIASGALHRIPELTEISFSNCRIESWWRSLQHQWLYLNTLETVSSPRSLASFHVQEHNGRLPHSAFRGQTPDEVDFKTGSRVPGELAA